MGEIQKANQFTTAISQWSNSITDLVKRDYEECGVSFDEYSKKCAMSAMTSIFEIVKSNKDITMNSLDKSNLREVVGQCASLKLNANSFPRECYFSLRKNYNSETKTYNYLIEMGIEGAGNDSLLRNFGQNVDTVYPYWVVKEGDVYIPPKHKGIELTPPEWEEKGLSNKASVVVYPVKLTDGTITYLSADRDSVKINLYAHVKQNLMNETFGILEGKKDKFGKQQTRYNCSEEDLAKIKEEKEKIFELLRNCKTVDDMIVCKEARKFMSGAWLDTPENMIVRKMCNNAIKKYPKDYDSMAKRSFIQMDETYKEAQEEIKDQANTVDFDSVIDAEIVEKEEKPFN